ncbi:hypothetical protein MLD38_037312 [Melastoma candidum]|uniref:Uncharacterized protein n=1 Tax=Melastoma candidum TaxID=119954 RepID=A0ACB9LLY4_9MYRT|nr:hypothetical protein MLD38_037312 [Melastoma candidum]
MTIMVFFFPATTPFGIALGDGAIKLVQPGLPNCADRCGAAERVFGRAAELMALVNLLGAGFLGRGCGRA